MPPAGWRGEGQSERPHGGLPGAVQARGVGPRQGQPPGSLQNWPWERRMERRGHFPPIPPLTDCSRQRNRSMGAFLLWAVPRQGISPQSWLAERASHRQTEVSLKWMVNCLQVKGTCRIRVCVLDWTRSSGSRDLVPTPWPLSFPCQFSRNPGQFQSLGLQAA